MYAQYWRGAYPGVWGPQFAINQGLSYNQFYIFHSAYELYPWLKISLSAATGTLTAVRLQTRCDANQWFHYQNLEFRGAATGTIVAIPGLAITTGTLCGNLAMTLGSTCGTYTVMCAAKIAGAQEVSIQQKTTDADGGGWGQHSNVAKYFLMANEVYLYGTKA